MPIIFNNIYIYIYKLVNLIKQVVTDDDRSRRRWMKETPYEIDRLWWGVMVLSQASAPNKTGKSKKT